ncbi:unnamed protein product [Cylicostephanus goldi]|uniref:Uncharacterized protein n=1 Tax=Cylicostephanus goldi TaxID=71465 RepID=A0A3P6RVR0_CYLGO|nr:unnamed protein product [Cylicostephanus goldi]
MHLLRVVSQSPSCQILSNLLHYFCAHCTRSRRRAR